MNLDLCLLARSFLPSPAISPPLNSETISGNRFPSASSRTGSKDYSALIVAVSERTTTAESYGTMLSQNGVTPRTAQAAMRHSKIDLTMNVYTDPRLLDVSGAMESLPSMPLDGQPRNPSETTMATGTDARVAQEFPPMFPPGTAQSGISGSISVTLGKMTETPVGESDRPGNVENPTKKGSFSRFENEHLKRPRRDLNPQPPDRQSGALTN
jgi:hypothetical protein